MIKPTFLERTDQPTTIGHVFGAPLVTKGITWLPLIELTACGILSWVAGSKHPEWSRRKRVISGTINGLILLVSEWCHNLAHAAFARWIGKPVDAIRIVWGTPILIYYDINDQQVTPRQHMIRAAGGPVMNGLCVPLLWFARQLSPRGSLFHQAADFGWGANAVLSTLSLLPIPGIDGGPMLKWALVQSGKTNEQADETVKGVNRALGLGLGFASGVAGIRGHKWLAAAMTLFAATALAVGFGLLEEQKRGNQETKNG